MVVIQQEFKSFGSYKDSLWFKYKEHKAELIKFEPYIILEIESSISEELSQWFRDNLDGQFYEWNTFTVFFEKVEDYILFKLRWV
jgi:hypothetical protein